MRKTADELALSLLLDGSLSPKQRDAKLKVLAKACADRLEGRVECPECGDAGPHADNGDVTDRLYCCTACGNHFEEV